MATEIVNDAPKAFAGWDSSIYFGWMEALSDLMMCANTEMLSKETIPSIGGLMLALTEATGEVTDRENSEARNQTAKAT